MNLLTPDDVLLGGVRRKSLCNGAIMAVTNGTMPKKKDRGRRGSLSEPPCRRASLVQRYNAIESTYTQIFEILRRKLISWLLKTLYLFLVKTQM